MNKHKLKQAELLAFAPVIMDNGKVLGSTSGLNKKYKPMKNNNLKLITGKARHLYLGALYSLKRKRKAKADMEAKRITLEPLKQQTKAINLRKYV